MGVGFAELLRAPVRVRGIQLGHPVDVILDAERRRAIGLEVQCGDNSRRFLPLSVVRYEDGELQIESPLVLLDERELEFYTKRGATYRSLLRADVAVRGARVGALEDMLLGEGGAIAALVVAAASGSSRIDYRSDVVLRAARAVGAAS
jgi:hypothetical protein